MSVPDESYSPRVYVRDAGEDMRRWLRHRHGDEVFVPSLPGPLASRRALELNEGSEAFLASYGDRTIDGFACFIDLRGFSAQVKARTAREAFDYVAPFLDAVINAAGDNDCLIDKTMGDEVMLLHPDRTDCGDFAPWLRFSHFLADLACIHRHFGGRYSFRVGLAYGSYYLGKVGGPDFKEWTVVGEAVNLAKRLHGTPELESIVADKGFGIACGILDREARLARFSRIEPSPLELILAYLHGVAYRPVMLGPVEFRGISECRAALLIPTDMNLKAEDNLVLPGKSADVVQCRITAGDLGAPPV